MSITAEVPDQTLNIFDAFGGEPHKGSRAEIEAKAEEAEVVEDQAPEAPAAEAEAQAQTQSPETHSPLASDIEHRNDETNTPPQGGQQNLRASRAAKPSAVKKPVAKKLVVPSLSSLSPLEKWKHVYTLEDARTGVWNKPTQVIGDLLHAQSALLTSGQPHSTKSLAWLQAALEAAAQQTVWDYFPAPHVKTTLFIETEDPEWLLQERIRGLAKGLGIAENDKVPGFHWVCPGPFNLVTDKGLEMLLDAYKPDFAVISTLQNIIPGRDLNDAKAMAPVNRKIIELTRKHCPIVMITHSTWDPKNKRAIGTITQTANYATTLHFEKKSGDSGDFVDAILDSKLGSKEQFQLRLQVEEVSSVEDGVEKKKTEVRRLVYKPMKSSSKKDQVKAVIKETPSASTEEIACKVGCTPRHVRDVKKDLVGGKKGPVVTSKKKAEGSPKGSPGMPKAHSAPAEEAPKASPGQKTSSASSSAGCSARRCKYRRCSQLARKELDFGFFALFRFG